MPRRHAPHLPPFHTPQERYRNVLRRDPCSYCGVQPAGTVDHIKGIAKHRGPHSWENLTACCARCNRKKGSMKMLDFVGRIYGTLEHPKGAPLIRRPLVPDRPLTYTIGELMRR